MSRLQLDVSSSPDVTSNHRHDRRHHAKPLMQHRLSHCWDSSPCPEGPQHGPCPAPRNYASPLPQHTRAGLGTAVTPAPTRHNEGSAAFRGTHPPLQEAPQTPRLPHLPPDGQRGQSLGETPLAAHHRAGAHSIPGSPAATTLWFPAIRRLQASWMRPPLAQRPLLSTAWPTSWKNPPSPTLPTPPHPVRSAPAQKSPS